MNLGIFILASGKIWHHKISFFSKTARYFIPEFKGSTKLIPKPLMITLTRVMTKTRIVMMSLRMSATFSLGSSLMLNPPITRKRIPTSAWKKFLGILYMSRFMSYLQCSNWRQILKLSSNIGCLFTFCYSAWANLLETKLQTCNLQTGQSISCKYVNKFWSNLLHPNRKK